MLGPRGTGKTSWLRARFPRAIYLDFLESEVYTALLASPERLEGMVPTAYRGWVVLDDVQRVPIRVLPVADALSRIATLLSER